eukprot:bmy_15885T0
MCLTVFPFIFRTMTGSMSLLDRLHEHHGCPSVVHEVILERAELAVLVPGVHMLHPSSIEQLSVKRLLQSVEIREAFRVLDRDGNGFISKQELGMAMRSLGYMPSEVELAIIMQRLDMDGSSLSGCEIFSDTLQVEHYRCHTLVFE